MDIFAGLPFLSFLVFAGILSARIFYLRTKGISVTSNDGKKNKSAHFLFPVFGLIFFLWLFETAKPAFQISFSIFPDFLTNFLLESIFLKISGTVFIVSGLIILVVTLVHFKTSLRFGLNENNRGKLITTGIFSVSRNPFFLAFVFYFAGVALILPSLFFIGFVVLSIVSIHFFILKEEKFLRNVYREEYKQYTERVRRYL